MEHTENGNIIRGTGIYEIPERYYTGKPVCEHCKSNRFRKNTYIVINSTTGEFKQVGKSCLMDFTNGLSAEAVASYIAFFEEVIRGEQVLPGGSFERYVEITEFLQYVTETVNKFGYVKKADADYGNESTCSRAISYNIVAFLTENADMVSAVLVGLATTVGILAVAWVVHAAAQWLAVAANQALIVSLLSNPILWIAIIIGVLVAAMYRWIQSIGGVKNAWEICKLALIVGWNAVKLAFFTGVYWVIDLVDKLKLCWQKAGVAIANFMGDMKVSVLMILQNMINGAIDIINKFIGVLNKIPGVSIDAIEHVTFATTAAAENEAAKSARAADLAAYESELASAKAGRDAHIDSLKAELNSSVDALQAAYAQAKADAAADSSAEQTALDSIGADTAGINDSAGSAAASLKETTEDLKYMRDLAEQEAINRFTTAEVKIDMTGMTNRIDSDMDLDGVLNTLTEGFAEALEVAAEGVHE